MSEELAVALLPVESLQSAVLPRSTGIDDDYALSLSESLHLLPPVLVQRSTMKLIDGSHRVRAHALRDRTHVAGLLVNADDTQALRHAVESNRRQGRPLSLADRRSAARRMIDLNPDWSDRHLAKACGLSGKTVAAIRRTCGVPQPSARVGMDGRIRPIDRDAGRRVARSVLENAPDAPLRAVAATAGISPTTALAVRERLRGAAGTGRDIDAPELLHRLSQDPSIRYTDSGRAMLHWLYRQQQFDPDDVLPAKLPAHCLPLVAELFRQEAARWFRRAEMVERRGR